MTVEPSKTQSEPYDKELVRGVGVRKNVCSMIDPNATGFVLVRSTAIDIVIGWSIKVVGF